MIPDKHQMPNPRRRIPKQVAGQLQRTKRAIGKASPALLHEVQQHQEAEPNETSQDNRIPPLLGSDLPHQIVHSGHLAGRADNPAVDACQSFTLDPEVLVDGIGLAEYAVHHVMTVVDPPALLEHVVCLSCAGIRCAVGINIGADIGEKVGAVARLRHGGRQALQLAAVVLKDFTVAGEVVLFQGGGGKGSFGVEEARELRDERFTLCRG